MSKEFFHEPADIGNFDISITQVNKPLVFTTTAGVIDPGVKLVLVTENGVKVREYTAGSGITREADGSQATISFNGPDFASLSGAVLSAEMSLFSPGDIDIIFKLSIIKSSL